MTTPYPMTFEPILKEKVWGGRRLGRLGKALTPGGLFGESWELADLASTSVSGGGGGAAVSTIRNGPMRGAGIGEAIARFGADLLGEAGMARAREFGEQTGAGRPVFPLLLKYLDAREHLSVQVHPSEAYAAANAGAHLKTESWFVIDAAQVEMPDGSAVEPTIFRGLRPGVTAEDFVSHIRDGSVAGDLLRERAAPGMCCTLPSGTVHALGAGVLVAEVQTPSDTTFRVYDWTAEYGRPERELHIEQALACIDFTDTTPGAPVDCRRGGRAAETDYYTIDAVHGGAAWPAGRAAAVMVYEGEGVVEGGGESVPLGAGTTVLIPAACACEMRGSLRSLVVGLA